MATEQLETLGTEDAKWLGEYSQVHMNVFGTPLRVMDHGEGAHIWDVDGNEYLDFLAGIAVNALGYAHPKWVKAVSEQAAKAAHVSNYFATEPQIKLAAKLVKLAGAPEGSRVYFGNSGAEANECAIKAARKWSEEKKGKDYSTIITLKNSFHGRTITTLAATGQDVFHHDFTPLTEGFVYAEPNDLADLEQLIKANKCAAGGAHLLHLDVMDGHFVPNITLGAPIVKCIRKATKLTFDVHLMISDPYKYVPDFAKAGSDIITFHTESDSDTEKTIDEILSLGKKAGLSVKPGTPIEEIYPYLDKLSLVLIMTVEPGFGGQSFMEDMMPKVTAVKNEIERRGLKDIDIEVDGGINKDTISVAAKAGANAFVSGSALFGSDDIKKTIADFKRSATI